MVPEVEWCSEVLSISLFFLISMLRPSDAEPTVSRETLQ